MNPSFRTHAPLLVEAQFRPPRLALRIDEDPSGGRSDATKPMLTISFVVASVADPAIAALHAAKGLPCEAEEWHEGAAERDLELYLNFSADPLTIRGREFVVSHAARSSGDTAVLLDHLRRLARHHQEAYEALRRAEHESRRELRHFLRQNIERARRSAVFFAASDPAKAATARARERACQAVLALLERRDPV